jgi:hypothetical protein
MFSFSVMAAVLLHVIGGAQCAADRAISESYHNNDGNFQPMN